MRALLVVNPKATATTARVRDVLAHALASETVLEVVETKRSEHATELAQAAVADGLDLVVALGGDGTVNEVVNGLLAGGPRPGLPALGVVPGGSTNVFARALGLPSSAVEATGELLEALRDDRRRTIGLGQANDRWFTFAAGLGLDAEVVRRVDQRRKAGRRATPQLFVGQAVKHFFHGADRREPRLHLRTDDGQVDVQLALALVCNTQPWTYVGRRPVLPCPEASFDDGLDVFGMRTLGTFTTLRYLRQILSSQPRLTGRKLVRLHDIDGFTLESDRPLAFQVDGDDLGDQTRVHFRAVRSALEIVA